MRKIAGLLLVLSFAVVSPIFAETPEQQSWSGYDWSYVYSDGALAQSQDESRLGYTAPTGESWAAYVTNDTIGFDNDFMAKIKVHNSAVLPGGLNVGFMRLNEQNMPAGSVYGDFYYENGGRYMGVFQDDGAGNETTLLDPMPMLLDEVWIGLMYNSGSDTMNFGIFSSDPMLVPGVPMWGDSVEGFTDQFGTDPAHFYLSGWSDLGALDGTMYFEGAGVNVSPEPVSSALFLLGGAVLAARRIKRKA